MNTLQKINDKCDFSNDKFQECTASFWGRCLNLEHTKFISLVPNCLRNKIIVKNIPNSKVIFEIGINIYISLHFHLRNYILWLDCILVSLKYPHAWVRLAGCQLLGYMFSQCKPAQIARDKVSLISCLLQEDTARKLQDLISIFISQLKSKYLDQSLAEQVGQ